LPVRAVNRAGAGLVEEIAGLVFDGGGIVSIDDAPKKEKEGLVETIDAAARIEAGLMEITAGIVEIEAGLIEITAGLVEITGGLAEIEAGLMKVIAAPVRAPSKLGFISFDLRSLR